MCPLSRLSVQKGCRLPTYKASARECTQTYMTAARKPQKGGKMRPYAPSTRFHRDMVVCKNKDLTGDLERLLGDVGGAVVCFLHEGAGGC